MNENFSNRTARDLNWKKLFGLKWKKALNFVEHTDTYAEDIPFVVKDPSIEKQDCSVVRYVCVSDTHGMHNEIPGGIPYGDVLIHAGDFTHCSTREELDSFYGWLMSQPHPRKIIVAGNHDVVFDRFYYEMFYSKRLKSQALHYEEEVCRLNGIGTYLESSGTTIFGQRVFGMLWPTRYKNCVKKCHEESEFTLLFSQMERGMDVLVTHGPPFGRLDADPVKHTGSISLLEGVRSYLQPRVHVYGHTHSGRGVSFDGQTLFVNCAVVDEQHRPINPAVVIDLPCEQRAFSDGEIEKMAELPEKAGIGEEYEQMKNERFCQKHNDTSLLNTTSKTDKEEDFIGNPSNSVDSFSETHSECSPLKDPSLKESNMTVKTIDCCQPQKKYGISHENYVFDCCARPLQPALDYEIPKKTKEEKERKRLKKEKKRRKREKRERKRRRKMRRANKEEENKKEEREKEEKKDVATDESSDNTKTTAQPPTYSAFYNQLQNKKETEMGIDCTKMEEKMKEKKKEKKKEKRRKKCIERMNDEEDEFRIGIGMDEYNEKRKEEEEEEEEEGVSDSADDTEEEEEEEDDDDDESGVTVDRQSLTAKVKKKEKEKEKTADSTKLEQEHTPKDKPRKRHKKLEPISQDSLNTSTLHSHSLPSLTEHLSQLISAPIQCSSSSQVDSSQMQQPFCSFFSACSFNDPSKVIFPTQMTPSDPLSIPSASSSPFSSPSVHSLSSPRGAQQFAGNVNSSQPSFFTSNDSLFALTTHPHSACSLADPSLSFHTLSSPEQKEMLPFSPSFCSSLASTAQSLPSSPFSSCTTLPSVSAAEFEFCPPSPHINKETKRYELPPPSALPSLKEILSDYPPPLPLFAIIREQSINEEKGDEEKEGDNEGGKEGEKEDAKDEEKKNVKDEEKEDNKWDEREVEELKKSLVGLRCISMPAFGTREIETMEKMIKKKVKEKDAKNKIDEADGDSKEEKKKRKKEKKKKKRDFLAEESRQCVEQEAKVKEEEKTEAACCAKDPLQTEMEVSIHSYAEHTADTSLLSVSPSDAPSH
ncbi:uncharacterized protein MONOS_8637 [Monocercomonoides exilis]|uniref:uncharacterized protein n=1 Tax=Monocercomonoides exilis TaxID=2049356 RepID=UPI0035598AD1|nr:hypothetical protein MONOS_8637 [Monocercomonoides exilis]|eukprot:MONOS_8637.1-p1 / transcript=MONOS_8637.1 / gene=MONOS_8637 / organism=Monocercomonoides_exilis_PA203 / gene_product=239AB / transcript_product=239AB / location=Mono_scaffold00330:46877-50130(+) / protein_length=1042 / sequence_SO=supercontig / SO=protein_coding / is_pseudo=false